MKEDQKRVYELFAKVLLHKLLSFEIQSDGKVIINFVKDLKYKPTNQKSAPWYFWFYTAIWQIELGDQILAKNNDDKSKIQNAINQLKGKKLLEIEAPGDKYDVRLMFEGNLVFHLMAEDYRDCNISIKVQKIETEA